MTKECTFRKKNTSKLTLWLMAVIKLLGVFPFGGEKVKDRKTQPLICQIRKTGCGRYFLFSHKQRKRGMESQ
jgi:hypothetical protein